MAVHWEAAFRLMHSATRMQSALDPAAEQGP
jgi:hypothetical protein